MEPEKRLYALRHNLFEEDGKVKVEFREPARAITPGQSAVFYIDQRVLGGGIIEGGF